MPANSNGSLSPISSSEFAGWMEKIGYFEEKPTIAVAVSGGADSMALLLLADKWARTKNGRIIALTVNHNLRTEAAAEAAQVGKWCAENAIEHHILQWEHSCTPTSAIQQSARDARYDLLTNWCRNNHTLHLLTAHHQGDQAETLFFRLSRGSGISGLSSMSAQTVINGVRLLRPLIFFPKSRLIATLQAHKQAWLEDPSNQNNAYSRVNIRQKIQSITDNQDLRKRLDNLTSKLGEFRNLTEKFIANELASSVEIFQYGYAVLDLNKKISPESLQAIVQALNGDKYSPRNEKLMRLYSEIYDNISKTRSFSGLLFELINNNKILIYREANAIQKPLFIPKNEVIIWDKRFKITSNMPLTIRSLSSDGLKIARKNSAFLLKNQPLDRIVRTLPSLWHLEELINIPHINYMSTNPAFSDLKTTIKFYPAKPLAAASFFAINSKIHSLNKESKYRA